MEPVALREWVFSNKLEDCYLVDAFIDGNYLTKRGKKGPIIKVILDNAIVWRVLNSEASKEQF